MPAFADSASALALLRDLSLHVGVLTNSATAPAVDAIEAADLGPHDERVIASDAVRAYKPATRVYRTAVEQLGVHASPPAISAQGSACERLTYR